MRQEWSSKISSVIFIPLYHAIIRTLQETCTSIIVRYLVNIHQRLQYSEETAAIHTPYDVHRKYMVRKVSLEFFSMVFSF